MPAYWGGSESKTQNVGANTAAGAGRNYSGRASGGADRTQRNNVLEQLLRATGSASSMFTSEGQGGGALGARPGPEGQHVYSGAGEAATVPASGGVRTFVRDELEPSGDSAGALSLFMSPVMGLNTLGSRVIGPAVASAMRENPESVMDVNGKPVMMRDGGLYAFNGIYGNKDPQSQTAAGLMRDLGRGAYPSYGRDIPFYRDAGAIAPRSDPRPAAPQAAMTRPAQPSRTVQAAPAEPSRPESIADMVGQRGRAGAGESYLRARGNAMMAPAAPTAVAPPAPAPQPSFKVNPDGTRTYYGVK